MVLQGFVALWGLNWTRNHGIGKEWVDLPGRDKSRRRTPETGMR